MNTDSPHNDINERNLLRDWQQKAIAKRKLHMDAYYHYSRINTAMGITTIILSAITGGTGLGTFHLDNVPMAVIIGIINLITAILSSVQHFCKFAAKSHTNEKVSIEFSNLTDVWCNSSTLGETGEAVGELYFGNDPQKSKWIKYC